MLKKSTLEVPILSPEEEDKFFQRLNEQLASREQSVKQIDAEVYGSTCTFKPTITRRKGEEPDTFDSDDENEKFEKFLRRVDDDLEIRREKMPQKYLATIKKKQEMDEMLNNSNAPFKT